MYIQILQCLAGLGALVLGADRFISGSAQTARALGVKPLVIGLTIVGAATSMPETLVGAVAAVGGRTGMAVGNAVGSNIANAGLVLGAALLARPMRVASGTLRQEFLYMCAAMVLAGALILDGTLSRFDGAVLVAALPVFFWRILRISQHARRTDPLAGEVRQELGRATPPGRALARAALGLVILLLGADLLVRGAVGIATRFGVSDLVIGLTVVAVGTSLPELAASVASAIKNEPDIAIGNVIGSNMFNMLMVLGVPGLIHPGTVALHAIWRDFAVMILFTAALGWMAFYRNRGMLTRTHGTVLLIAFFLYQFGLFAAGA